MSWLTDELDASAREWEQQCELTKPLINAPYWDVRKADCGCARCGA